MADSAVARSDGDVFELDVHIVLGCYPKSTDISEGAKSRDGEKEEERIGRTFEQLASVDLAGRDLESDDMALQKNCSVSGGSEQAL